MDKAKRPVAKMAKQTPDLSGRMVVIYGQLLYAAVALGSFWLAANGANAALARQDRAKLCVAKTEFSKPSPLALAYDFDVVASQADRANAVQAGSRLPKQLRRLDLQTVAALSCGVGGNRRTIGDAHGGPSVTGGRHASFASGLLVEELSDAALMKFALRLAFSASSTTPHRGNVEQGSRMVGSHELTLLTGLTLVRADRALTRFVGPSHFTDSGRASPLKDLREANRG